MAPCSGRCLLKPDQGPDAQKEENRERREIGRGGKEGSEEEEKEGWRKKEKIEKGGGREGEKGKERKGRRERLFSQLICLEIKNRTCTVGFLQPSGRELMEKIVQKNVADPW